FLSLWTSNPIYLCCVLMELVSCGLDPEYLRGCFGFVVFNSPNHDGSALFTECNPRLNPETSSFSFFAALTGSHNVSKVSNSADPNPELGATHPAAWAMIPGVQTAPRSAGRFGRVSGGAIARSTLLPSPWRWTRGRWPASDTTGAPGRFCA